MKNPILFSLWLMASQAVSKAGTVEAANLKLDTVNVTAGSRELDGKKAVAVTKAPEIKAVDEATFARIAGPEFHNGTIELKVLSRLLKDAPDFARGFIGVAFRINGDNSKFESIYIRPDNGRADDQLRRNHSIQYFSYPEFKFDRLRVENPGKYEAYADMGLNEWITLKIVVRNETARLFLNGGTQPALIVNDLKHGAAQRGAVGLWVDIGTEGFFTDVRIVAE